MGLQPVWTESYAYILEGGFFAWPSSLSTGPADVTYVRIGGGSRDIIVTECRM